MGITREEIKNLLKEAIEPLERKLDNLNNGFQELKRLVDFVNGKYDDVLVQLKQANEKIQRQGTSLRQMRKDLEDATKRAQDAMNGFENLAEYLRRDCLEISGVPPSESYTCNQLVMAVVVSPDKNDPFKCANDNYIESHYYSVKKSGKIFDDACKQKGFSIFHCNIRSLGKNKSLLHDILSTVKTTPDIIALSESKINENTSANLNIPGYAFVLKLFSICQ